MFESSNSNEEISRCFFYVGVAELREKYNQKALLNFQKSLEYRRKVTKNLSTETGLIHSQIGIVHLMTGDFEGAVKEFDTASKCLSLSRTFELMECYSNLGQAYLGLGKEEAAKSNF
jgi:tetratricopeptide (TPR) repeat protein